MVNNAVRLNGLTGLAITKLDVLDGFDTLNICTGYEANGERIQDFPSSLKTLSACRPIYETLPGWEEDITGSTRLEDLPDNTRNYLDRIEEITETPIEIISVGAGRNQTILKTNPFK